MSNERIRAAVEETKARLEADPEVGRGPDSPATATHVEGLKMRVEGPNDWAVRTDHASNIGGTETAPNPGWYWRASLAACDASVIRIEAARRDIELSTLEVTVESESDVRGRSASTTTSRRGRLASGSTSDSAPRTPPPRSSSPWSSGLRPTRRSVTRSALPSRSNLRSRSSECPERSALTGI